MKENDECIYTIAITGIKGLINQKALTDELPKHVGGVKMRITPAMITTPGTITIPRLYTFWRGDTSEQAWQSAIMEMVKERGAACAIDVQPFAHAPGYPQGDLSL